MSGGGSVVVRRQLGSKLRRLRLAAGKDVADVVTAGLGSKAKISRIETGKGPVKIADVRALCWLYGADAATTEALAALAPGTQQEDWWQPLGTAVVPEWFGLYAGLEATASKIRGFEPDLIHGLLQTPAYARAVIGADPRLSAEVVEQRVRFRLERQQTPARTHDHHGRGSAAAHRRFARRSWRPSSITFARSHAAVRVLPFSAGAYPRRGSFALLDFDDDEDPSVAYVEGPGERAITTGRTTELSTSTSGSSCSTSRSPSRSGPVTETPWIKASASADQGSCVEQRFVDGVMEVRDSKDQGNGPVLRFTWTSLPHGSTARSVESSTTCCGWISPQLVVFADLCPESARRRRYCSARGLQRPTAYLLAPDPPTPASTSPRPPRPARGGACAARL